MFSGKEIDLITNISVVYYKDDDGEEDIKYNAIFHKISPTEVYSFFHTCSGEKSKSYFLRKKGNKVQCRKCEEVINISAKSLIFMRKMVLLGKR